MNETRGAQRTVVEYQLGGMWFREERIGCWCSQVPWPSSHWPDCTATASITQIKAPVRTAPKEE